MSDESDDRTKRDRLARFKVIDGGKSDPKTKASFTRRLGTPPKPSETSTSETSETVDRLNSALNAVDDLDNDRRARLWHGIYSKGPKVLGPWIVAANFRHTRKDSKKGEETLVVFDRDGRWHVESFDTALDVRTHDDEDGDVDGERSFDAFDDAIDFLDQLARKDGRYLLVPSKPETPVREVFGWSPIQSIRSGMVRRYRNGLIACNVIEINALMRRLDASAAKLSGPSPKKSKQLLNQRDRTNLCYRWTVWAGNGGGSTTGDCRTLEEGKTIVDRLLRSRRFHLRDDKP